jgi:eukaryotic-like serine/threonine-protein kinase
MECALGSGGMGEVHRGTDTVLRRPVAIKFLTRHAPGQSTLDQLLAEARTASALNHANVCTVYEVTEAEGRPCIVMEYVEGQALSTLIPPDVGLPIDTTVAFALQIVDALSYAHERSIVHRDLKCGNIIITPQRRVKVLDFGLAIEGLACAVGEATSTIGGEPESEPSTAGTLRYMAPELLRGARADHRTDIWALGVVLYEMAAGRRPFDGKTSHEVSAAILAQSPGPLPSRVPTALRAIIQTCLAKDRDRRYRSAAEVRAALEAVLFELQVGRGRPSTLRRLAGIAGIAALTITVAALSQEVWQFVQRTPPNAIPVVAGPPATYVAVLPITDIDAPLNVQAVTEDVVKSVIDGIADATLANVKVIALPTAMRFQKNVGNLLASAREELHVEYVVTIKVAKQRQRVTFSAALNDALDQSQLWGQVYDLASGDRFDIPTRISTEVVDRMRRRLANDSQGPEPVRREPGRPPTQDYQAYELYAKGRHFWYLPTATGDNYQRAIECYEAAIKRDSNYALAYLGLADAFGSLGWEGWIPPREAHEKLVEALAKVARLDPSLGQAHYTRAGLYLMEKKWAEAEAEYKAAIAAVPSSEMNRRFYGFFLLGRGRVREAFAVLEEAARRDPEGLGTNLALATAYYWANNLDVAITRLNETIALDSSNPSTAAVHEILADVYEAKGLLPQAIHERQIALRMNGDAEASLSLGRDYADSGFGSAMRRLYQGQLQLAASRQRLDDSYVSPLYYAVLFIHLNDPDRAFKWLDNAVDEGAPWLNSVRTDPAFATLRADPRYADFMRRSELPPNWSSPH